MGWVGLVKCGVVWCGVGGFWRLTVNLTMGEVFWGWIGVSFQVDDMFYWVELVVDDSAGRDFRRRIRPRRSSAATEHQYYTIASYTDCNHPTYVEEKRN